MVELRGFEPIKIPQQPGNRRPTAHNVHADAKQSRRAGHASLEWS